MTTSSWRKTPFKSDHDQFWTALFQHAEEVELPERCQEFFEQFQREQTRRTPSIPGSTSNDVEKAQRLERPCAPAASWMASADKSWHSTMDSPAGEIDVQW